MKEWLRQQWKISNANKYQHYFEEWFSNVTSGQLTGFEKQRFNLENRILL